MREVPTTKAGRAGKAGAAYFSGVPNAVAKPALAGAHNLNVGFARHILTQARLRLVWRLAVALAAAAHHFAVLAARHDTRSGFVLDNT